MHLSWHVPQRPGEKFYVSIWVFSITRVVLPVDHAGGVGREEMIIGWRECTSIVCTV